jgi:hypothetical protein
MYSIDQMVCALEKGTYLNSGGWAGLWIVSRYLSESCVIPVDIVQGYGWGLSLKPLEEIQLASP